MNFFSQNELCCTGLQYKTIGVGLIRIEAVLHCLIVTQSWVQILLLFQYNCNNNKLHALI